MVNGLVVEGLGYFPIWENRDLKFLNLFGDVYGGWGWPDASQALCGRLPEAWRRGVAFEMEGCVFSEPSRS